MRIFVWKIQSEANISSHLQLRKRLVEAFSFLALKKWLTVSLVSSTCLIIYHIFSKKKKKHALSFQEHTGSNLGYQQPYGFWEYSGVCETPAAGLHVSKWRILIRNKTISEKLVSKETNYDDHLPKLITEHSV